jgi:general stress protein 26
LTLATVREDGYAQATTVSYANDALTIYVATGKEAQKVKNIRRSNKVSLTIDTPYKDRSQIKGLPIGATAEVLADDKEITHALGCIVRKFPQAVEWTKSAQAADIVVLKITPKIISMLDYTKGFGHTEVVSV